MNLRLFKSWLARVATAGLWELAGRHGKIGSRIPVLCYHRVLPDFHEGQVPIYSLLPEQFEAQLAFLTQAGFATLSLTEYAEIARGFRSAPEKGVVITFDDGYADTQAIAWPLATKYRIKLNLFLCTGYIGEAKPLLMTRDGYRVAEGPGDLAGEPSRVQAHIQRFPHLWRPLGWPELRQMQTAGVEVGFHSHSHRQLTRLPLEELRADLAAGLDLLGRELNFQPRCFALPYGWYDSYTPGVIDLLQSRGLDLIFAAHWGRARLPSNQPIFPRLAIYQEDSLGVFERKLYGFYDWLGKILRLEHTLGTINK